MKCILVHHITMIQLLNLTRVNTFNLLFLLFIITMFIRLLRFTKMVKNTIFNYLYKLNECLDLHIHFVKLQYYLLCYTFQSILYCSSLKYWNIGDI